MRLTRKQQRQVDRMFAAPREEGEAQAIEEIAVKLWFVILMIACAGASAWNWTVANSSSGIDFENRGMLNAILGFVFAISAFAFLIATLLA